MTLLPIVERELRVRARRRAGHWTRFGIGLGAFLICLPQLLISGPFGAPGSVGKVTFDCIVGAAFLLSCGACFLTANALVAEQQEGTLGLLFLTRVNALDVLLGKFGSVGLTSLCSLLAFVPVMLVPILAGGVTGGEALRKGVALLLTLPLALALGLWASVASRRFGVGRTTVGAILLIVVIPYLLWQARSSGLRFFGLVSPLVCVVAAGDFSYKLNPLWFWGSALGTVVLATVALLGAALRLRRVAFREVEPLVAPPAAASPSGGAGVVQTSNTASVPWRPQVDEASPVAWLVRRQPGLKARLWTAALLTMVYHLAMMVLPRWIGPTRMGLTWSFYWLPSIAVSALESGLIAWAVSQFFMEGRRSAAFEVLFTTPLGAKTVVADQWKALQRLLRGPVLVMLIPNLVHLLLALQEFPSFSRSAAPAGYRLQYIGSLALSAVGILLHVGALCWLGLWYGWKARGQAGAILWTVLVTTVGPYLLSMLVYGVLAGLLFSALGGTMIWSYVASWLSQMLTMGFYLGIILWARRRLMGVFSGAAPACLSLKETVETAARDTASAIRRARHWTPS
jgi:hypothetical protein